MTFHHPPHVKVFDADAVVSDNQVSCHFVQVILPGITDMFLYACNADALPVPPAPAFGAAGENTLGRGKTSLVFTRMHRVRNPLSVAGGSQAIDSKVDSNGLAGGILFGKVFIQNQCDEISPAGHLGNCDGSWGRLELPAPMHIQSPQSAHDQVWVVWVRPGELEGRDRICGALPVPLLFEGGVFTHLVEKLNKGVVQVADSLLCRNTRNLTQPPSPRLPLPPGQFGGGLAIADALTAHLPSISLIPQRPVIYIPATSENFRKFGLLAFGWVKPKLVSNLHTKNIYV
jgi:hypothetical protein